MFDKLKRIFIVEDEGAKSGPKSNPKEKTEQAAPIAQKPTSTTTRKSDSSSAGTQVTKFTNILFGAIEANNLEGFDYLEYKESLRSLAKMDMDEPTKYKSAFAMAQTMGATPQKLIESATHYRNILAKEEVKFGQALENQRSLQINEEHQRLAELKKGIEMKKNKVLELQKAIAADEKAITKVTAGIDKAASKIEQTQANFIASYKQIADQLDSDIEKIKTYLK